MRGESDSLSSAAISLIIFCVYTTAPLFITTFLYKNKYRLDDNEFKSRYGSFYPGTLT